VRYPIGTPVAVSVVAGLAPTLLVGDTAVAAPPT
jgi:iron(III) transport system ATP-binding protein